MDVKDLMNKDTVAVFGGDTVQKAAEEMGKYNRGLVVVFDTIENKKVIGVVSNKDIINKVIAKGISPKKVFIREVMNKNPVSVKPTDHSSKAMGLMRDKGIKRVIVLENGALQGIISSNDILDAMVKYKKQLLEMAIDF